MKSDFDKSFNRTMLMIKIWGAVVVIGVLTVWGVMGYSAYRVVSDPSIIGQVARQVVKGYEGK